MSNSVRLPLPLFCVIVAFSRHVFGQVGSTEGCCQANCSFHTIVPTTSVNITTPYYPHNYTNNASCKWLIDAGNDSQLVKLTVIDFCTEDGYDFVYLYDGVDASDDLLLDVIYGCDNVTSGMVYLSSQRYMFIRFTSDATVVRRGAAASVLSIEDASFGACGKNAPAANLTAPNGSFTSQFYSIADYKYNTSCKWLIVASSATQVINITFTNFCTERGYDYVALYDGSDSSAVHLMEQAGCNLPLLNFVSTQPYMFITFTSDDSNEFSGFRALYSSISKGNTSSKSMQTRLVDTTEGNSSPTTTIVVAVIVPIVIVFIIIVSSLIVYQHWRLKALTAANGTRGGQAGGADVLTTGGQYEHPQNSKDEEQTYESINNAYVDIVSHRALTPTNSSSYEEMDKTPASARPEPPKLRSTPPEPLYGNVGMQQATYQNVQM